MENIPAHTRAKNVMQPDLPVCWIPEYSHLYWTPKTGQCVKIKYNSPEEGKF